MTRLGKGSHLMTAFETRALFKQLEATVEENLDRHLAAAEDWMPHEYVPWSEGRNFAALGGEPWSIVQSRLSPIARTGSHRPEDGSIVVPLCGGGLRHESRRGAA